MYPDETREPTALQTGSIHLRAQTFSVFYGANHAVKGITMDIMAGGVTALIGPSGCGKSTFLRAMNRMNDLVAGCHTDGLLEFDREDIYGPQIDVVTLRRRIGMVFQKPNPFPKSIFDNVAYGPRLHTALDKSKLTAIVERSLVSAALWDEVKDRLHHNAMSLSGGQQQRLCIARSLALEPEVLLLDEPTSGLDPISTAKVEESLSQLKQLYTIIIVPHSVQQAARVADHAAFFLMGELVEYQAGDGIFTGPRDRRTEDYITGRFG